MVYQFDSDLAEQYGVEEAIMIANLMYWIRKNEANGKHYHDGRYWTYNSIEAFVSLFPFWSKKQIRRILQSLVDKEVIVLGNYNSSTYDRTTWYAFGNSMLLNGKIHLPKWENGSAQMGKPIPDIENTDIENTDNILLPPINIPPKKFDFRESLLSLGVAECYINDWLIVRKNKKASNTESALKRFIAECNKADITVAAAVQMCAENSWQGFKAEYLNNNNNGIYQSRQRQDSRRETPAPSRESISEDDWKF